MNKKFSLGICISLIAIACAVTFVLTMTVSLNMYNQKIAGVTEREEIYSKLQEIDSYVRNNYNGSIDESELIASILDGYLSSVDKKNGNYLTAEEYYSYQQEMSGSIIGLGIVAEKEESGYIKVKSVYSGSPAATAGITENDIITSVDSSSVLEKGAEDSIKALSGEEGTKCELNIRRNGDDQVYSLTRKPFDVISVNHTIAEQCGYIRISGFNKLTTSQFISAVDQLEAQNVTGLIIDVRDVSSRYYDGLKDILNRIVGAGTVAYATYKENTVKTFIETGSDNEYTAPIIILANSGTAGTGELMAAVLKDSASAQIVGANTFGDDVLTYTQSFKDGTAATVAVASVKSAKSDSYASVGVKPDFTVEMTSLPESNLDNLSNTADMQILKAFEVMKSLTATVS